MLKRIKIQNFLSLKELILDLRDRNFLVGPNMSGKSNLIECFKFLQDSIRRSPQPGVTAWSRAVNDRGGFDCLVWRGRTERPISIDVSAELESNQGTGLFTYSIVFGRGEHNWPQVLSETLTLERKRKRELLIENGPSGMKVAGLTGGSQNTLGLALELYAHLSPSIALFAEFVAGWQVYRLLPAMMRSGNPPTREERLSEHGENLTAWLFRLQSYPTEFEAIKRVARDALSGLEEIVFQPQVATEPPTSPPGQYVLLNDPAKICVSASETNFRRPVSLARMSDGQLAFLALLSLILAPQDVRPTLLLIEEPENYLHTRLLEILVSLLDQQALRRELPQLIATTHSLPLVDKLNLEDLVVAGKTDGATRLTRPSSSGHLKKLLADKELSLGDLLYSGALSDA